jgi:hypothetical protein
MKKERKKDSHSRKREIKTQAEGHIRPCVCPSVRASAHFNLRHRHNFYEVVTFRKPVSCVGNFRFSSHHHLQKGLKFHQGMHFCHRESFRNI